MPGSLARGAARISVPAGAILAVLSGDVTSTVAGVSTVVGITGTGEGGVVNVHAGEFLWDSNAIVNPLLTQGTLPGTGANAGNSFVVQAQGGQAQTGATANNNGGQLMLIGGGAGTGGSGAAASPGGVVLVSGSCNVSANGAPTAAAAFLGLLNCPGITWQSPTDAPSLTQAVAGIGVAPNGFTVSPQAPNAGSATTASGTPGNFVVNLAAPVSTGNHAYIDVRDGGTTILKLGTSLGAVGTATLLSPTSLLVEAQVGSCTMYGNASLRLSSPTHSFTDLAFNPWLTITASAAISATFAAGATAPTITQAVSTGGPAVAMAITAQSAGGTNDGGALKLSGGAHAGVSTADGSVAILTPLNVGELEFAPVNGAQSLTNAQSNANVLNLLAGATAGFTVTLLRRIVDTSLLFVRNNTTQVATIAYLTGGTVTVAAGTSAVVASNGANLVKIVVGT